MEEPRKAPGSILSLHGFQDGAGHSEVVLGRQPQRRNQACPGPTEAASTCLGLRTHLPGQQGRLKTHCVLEPHPGGQGGHAHDRPWPGVLNIVRGHSDELSEAQRGYSVLVPTRTGPHSRG
ncbi:uncharacterized protein LOC118146302 isoform X2 [Callithrix jacchus]